MGPSRLPLKKYIIPATILKPDTETYTSYSIGKMPYGINYADMVKTLKINPKLYHCPIVEFEDNYFFVRGNNVFYDAGVEAGLSFFICYVNMITIKDKPASQLHLTEVISAKSIYGVSLIFFLNNVGPSQMRFQETESFNAELNSMLHKAGYRYVSFFEVIDFETIGFKIVRDEIPPEDPFDAAKLILSKFGIIRSINGLISECVPPW